MDTIYFIGNSICAAGFIQGEVLNKKDGFVRIRTQHGDNYKVTEYPIAHVKKIEYAERLTGQYP